jgi:hypothetical protein
MKSDRKAIENWLLVTWYLFLKTKGTFYKWQNENFHLPLPDGLSCLPTAL